VRGHESFDARFAHLFDVAMRPAIRILRSAAPAEDVAAEVLARTFVDWSRLEGAPWLDAWIVRVSTNLAIDQVRRSSRRFPRIAVADSGELEVRLDLATAVAQLPRRQREAVSLRYFGDLSERDVAALMDVSVGSVKTHLHRGLATLRERLGDAWRSGADVEVPLC
jgi:RNA polymerase sigma factor (sigma-70 family)